MLFEICLLPLNSPSESHSEQIARAVSLIHGSGLPYQVNAFGTCVEGEWEAVVSLAKQCLDKVRETSPHTVLLLRVEDDGTSQSKIQANVNSVAVKLAEV